MNKDWIIFLKSNTPTILEDTEKDISQEKSQNLVTALTHLAIVKVTGTDANTFLQGQLTCNINELTESKSFFTAFCNAKGRTISTILIVKTSTGYLLILPNELIKKASQKLQMYIMRSDVQLKNATNDLCLIGINTQTTDTLPSLPKTCFTITQDKEIFVKFPLHNNRFLIIASSTEAISLWGQLSKIGFIPCHSNLWITQDISAGIPWLTPATSEEYIPQMLNIDKLGGISFNKGCYTGQEIVARTHYLGKAKRELFLASCSSSAQINHETKIINKISEQTIGKVLSLISTKQDIKMLIIMQSTTDTELNNLILNNSDQNMINIIDFQ